jgi:alkylated DNA repair dioxygenase AlkB
MEAWSLPPSPPSWPAPLPITAPGLALRLWPGWLQQFGFDADALQRHLGEAIAWEQPTVRLFGHRHAVPRLTCWLGDRGCHYRYSGLLQLPQPWTPPLQELRRRLEEGLGCRFNSLLLNRYRSGDDRMGWHADDEPELAADQPIASLSLGAVRCLRFRPRPASGRVPHPLAAGQPPLQLELAHGDLLVMDGPTQRHWQHALPARRRVSGERINLTFRLVRPGRAAAGA